jgi:hypothetical protein
MRTAPVDKRVKRLQDLLDSEEFKDQALVVRGESFSLICLFC